MNTRKLRILLCNMFYEHGHPPLAIATLKAYALKFPAIRDHADIELFHATIGDISEDQFVRHTLDFKPDVIGFSCYLWSSDFFIRTMRDIKRSSGHDVFAIAGGPDAHAEMLASAPHINVVVIGEGEETFRELIECRIQNRDWKDTAGTAYMDKNGLHENPARPLIENLDDIPSPYLTAVIAPDKTKFIEFNRGCDYRCGYCSNSRTPYRSFSLDRLEQEILDCIRTGAGLQLYGVSYIKHGEYGRGILNLIRKHQAEGANLRMADAFFIDRNDYDPEFLDLLAEISTRNSRPCVEFSLDCMDRGTRRVNRRANNIQAMRHIARHCARNRIRVYVETLTGMPGDTLLKFAKTLCAAASLCRVHVMTACMRCIPHTHIYENRDALQIRTSQETPNEFRKKITASLSMDEQENRKTELLAHSFALEFHAFKYDLHTDTPD